MAVNKIEIVKTSDLEADKMHELPGINYAEINTQRYI